MSSNEILLRDATDGDSAAVRELCRRLNPSDYVIDTWDDWMRTPGDVHVVAELGERIVGCVRAGIVAPGEAFSQGLRVEPALRRRGVARSLMALQDERLCERGVSMVRGVTANANAAARTFFTEIGFREAGLVARRRLSGWVSGPPPAPARVPGLEELDRATVEVRRRRLLASHAGRAHFKRIYFSPSSAWLAEVLTQGRYVEIGDACAIFDPWRDDEQWITAFSGSPSTLASWIELRAGQRSGRPAALVLEAADEPDLQSRLDRLGFTPAGTDDRYVVLEVPVGVVRRAG